MKKLHLSTHESASSADSFKIMLVSIGFLFVLIAGVVLFSSRNNVQAGVFDFESGTPRSKVLKVLGGPIRSYSYNRVDKVWVRDDGFSADMFVRAHLPGNIVSRAAWQWGSCLVFFDDYDQVVFWCRLAQPPKD